MPKNSWKKLSSKVLLEHPRLLVVEDRVLLPNGKNTEYLTYSEAGDFVTIIAIRENGDIAVISEYSYPLDTNLQQFPEGKSDAGEAPKYTALRELAEEIGYTAGSLEIIGSVPKNHRRDTVYQHVLLATDLSKLDMTKDRDAEEIGLELSWMSQEEITQHIADGKIIQRNTLCAWALYLSKQLQV